MMTYEEVRITYKSDGQMARAMFEQVAQLEAAVALAEAQRDKLKKKLIPPATRRVNRDREEN